MQNARHLLRRFHRDERGVFAVVFGILAVVLIALGGAVVDYVTLQQARSRSQSALDAATLALQASINNPAETDDTIRQKVEAFVLDRLGTNQIRGAQIGQVVIDRDKGELLLSGTFAVETIFVKLVGVDLLHATVTSQARKGITNVEVAVALDVTGSMKTTLPSGDTRLAALQKAVTALVDEVLALNTSENYAKVALVPYSQAINAGKYAQALRGPIRAEVTIDSANWRDGRERPITTVSNERTAVLTAMAHGFATNDYVYVAGTNFSAINDRIFQVTRMGPNTVSLTGLDTSKVVGTITGGTVSKCLIRTCGLVLTTSGHQFGAGEAIEIVNAAGMPELNGIFTVTQPSANTFSIDFASFSRTRIYTAKSAKAHCITQSATNGCSHYRFTNAASGASTHAVTTCITERSPNGATDTPPSTQFMGRNYPHHDNGCSSGELVPLTRNKAELSKAITSLVPNGSTSGSLGILGAWHMLSPKFGYMWPQESRPAPYLERNLMKAAVIMTDGEFNTVHCNGVVSNISTDGSFSWTDRHDQINCAAPNGSPYAQAQAYCNAMKHDTGIVVFTVGLGITRDSDAAKALRSCASRADTYFLADNTADLVDDFRNIALQISALRLTR